MTYAQQFEKHQKTASMLQDAGAQYPAAPQCTPVSSFARPTALRGVLSRRGGRAALLLRRTAHMDDPPPLPALSRPPPPRGLPVPPPPNRAATAPLETESLRGSSGRSRGGGGLAGE